MGGRNGVTVVVEEYTLMIVERIVELVNPCAKRGLAVVGGRPLLLLQSVSICAVCLIVRKAATRRLWILSLSRCGWVSTFCIVALFDRQRSSTTQLK